MSGLHEKSSSTNWSVEEERLVKEMVEKDGMKNWEKIARKLAANSGKNLRLGKQCRERYLNFIKYEGRRRQLLLWTPQEKEKLFDLFLEYGSKWVLIAGHFSEKSQNCVKNRFYGCIRKLVRGLNKILDSEKKSHKDLRYESVIKALQFESQIFEARYGDRLSLRQLKFRVIEASKKQIEDLNHEDCLDLISKINAFNLFTRSTHRKTIHKQVKKQIKYVARTKLIEKEEEIVKLEPQDYVKIQEEFQEMKPVRFARNLQ